jgi:nucleotide-binding universal stress UspA family protein
MKSILVHVHDDDGRDARLSAALDVARAFDGRLTCLLVRPYEAYVAGDPFGGMHVLASQLEDQRRREEKVREAVDARLAREGVPHEWASLDGDPARSVIAAAKLADLVVLRRAGHALGLGAALPVVADVAIHARAPVLAVPPEARGLAVDGPALVAWNGSAEAAHALRAAVPLLARASAVHLVTVADGSEVSPDPACDYLESYGVACLPRVVEPRGREVADALIDEAGALGAGYIVMGAYGHSRVREYLLGGATRDLLGRSPLPLFLTH